MTTTIPPASSATDDAQLKNKHRVMWALGDYPGLATDVIPDLGAVLVRACEVGPGDRVLDVAAGSGNVAIPAALTGASVIASDLTPELLAAGREQAIRRGATLDWQPADVENLPYQDDQFDAVLSCVGVMFAPHHQRAADEMLRVLRPGGTLGLISWTPEGFVGQMFAAMKPYAPPPPPGAQPPPLWGSEDYVGALLGDRIERFSARRQMVRVDGYASATEFRDDFKARYGPTVAAYRALASEPARVAALDGELAELGRRHGAGVTGMEWEYLLVTGRKRGMEPHS